MMSETCNLKYKRTPELREEILSAVGVPYNGRFQRNSDAGIRKHNLLLIAEELRPDDHKFDDELTWDRGEERDKNMEDLTVSELYDLIGEWIGVEYEGCSGHDWTLNRVHLKAVHREIINE